MAPNPPTHILETCLYVKDIASSLTFYQTVLRLDPFLNTPRMAAFALGHTTLILFQLGLTAADSHPTPSDTIPGHGPSDDLLTALLRSTAQEREGGATLKLHYCLAVAGRADVVEWEAWFAEKDVKVLGTMEWERGGRSVYFSDPDGHVGEIGCRGIWEHY